MQDIHKSLLFSSFPFFSALDENKKNEECV